MEIMRERHTADTLPLAVLLGSAAFVAGVTFAVSAHGLVDFGERVMGLPSEMAWCVPVGVDFLQLVTIAAWFLVRDKEKRVRFYMWLVMAVAIGASMAGNRWDALERNLPTAGVNATMIAPALLALTAHVIVITWRHREQASVEEPAEEPESVAQPPPKPARVRAKSTSNRKARALALKGTMPYEEIAKRLGVSLSTVNRDLKEPSPNGHEPVGEMA